MDVEKLKQKILDLAIRGKLVPQDPNDEPASALVEKIRAEKQKLIKEGKIKPSKNESYIYKGSDNLYYEKVGNKTTCIENVVPFKSPNNWIWARLNTVLDVRDGTHDSPKYHENGIPFVTSKNLKNGEIDFSICKRISREDANRFDERSKVDDKDILFAMIGTIGNPVIVKKDREFSIKNVALFKNIDTTKLSEKWIAYYLEYVSEKMKKDTSSGLQPFVSLDFLRNYLIPIPPIDEQKRIVKEMERFLKIAKSIANNYDSLCNDANRIKLRILDAVFGENSSYKSYYPKIKLNSICFLDKGTISSGEKLPYLEAKVIRKQKEPKYEKSGIKIIKGTDVILVDGENSGEVMTAPCDGYMGSTFRILRFSEKIDRDYLLLFLFYNKQRFKDNKKGSAIPHLNKKLFNELTIVFPDIDVQRKISNEVLNKINLLHRIQDI